MRHNIKAKEEAAEAEEDEDASVSRPVSVQDVEKQAQEKPGSAGSGVGREKTEVSRVSALGKTAFQFLTFRSLGCYLPPPLASRNRSSVSFKFPPIGILEFRRLIILGPANATNLARTNTRLK